MEKSSAQAIRHARRRRPVHRHARGEQGLLSGSRSQRLCRSVGLGKSNDAAGAQSRLPYKDSGEDLEGDYRSREARASAFPSIERRPISESPREADLHSRGGHPRSIPGASWKAEVDGNPSGIPGGVHLRDRRDVEDGYPHELRAADYDDWVTETTSKDEH